MKFLLILLFVLPTFAQVEARYDKFKDQTVVSFNDGYVIGKDAVHGRIKFYAYYVEKKGEREYFLRFTDTNHLRLKFDDRRNLIFLVLGERIDFGKGGYNVTNEKYGLKESMTFPATKGDLELIARSPKVEFQLGTFEAELSEKQKQGVKELLEYQVK